MGGNMSSRLFEEVREERGLAYEINSSVKRYHDTGDFVISAGVDTRKVAQAVKVIIDELDKIKRKPPGAEEFKRAKEFYKGQFLLTLEDTMHRMVWLGEKIMSGEKHYRPAQTLKYIESVGPEDVSEAAKDIFKTDRLSLALIGPLKGESTDKIKKLLRLD
jgi:predicted Zn-dependent peptidase